jgi:twitching motility protein PilT
MVATKADVMAAIDRFHRGDDEMDELASGFQDADHGDDLSSMTEVVEDAPIVKFVNILITQAVQDRASDIHIEPAEKDLRVRFRIDGVLHEVMRSPKSMTAGVTSRLKIMADINIAERRIPQDGRLSTTVNGKKVDLRVATLPTVWGEKIVMRILDNSSALMKLSDLGFGQDNYDVYEKSFVKPYGMILVTGPTGSGKSTTLYATLNIVSNPKVNVITVEDPVEYRLEGINQVQTNAKAGLTFAAALRSILRSDPDVVLLGEIRDRETAHIAVEAALTGHLVLSTLHTNDAPSAIVRLTEMGIEPFLVGSALDCVLAQRLARKLCPSAGGVRPDAGGARRHADAAAGRRAGADAVPAGRVQRVRQDGVPRPHRPARGDGRQRGHRAADRRAGLDDEHRPEARSRAWSPCARTACRRSRPATPRWRRSCASSSDGLKGPAAAPDACRRCSAPDRPAPRKDLVDAHPPAPAGLADFFGSGPATTAPVPPVAPAPPPTPQLAPVDMPVQLRHPPTPGLAPAVPVARPPHAAPHEAPEAPRPAVRVGAEDSSVDSAFLADLLIYVLERGCSDLHLTKNARPTVRQSGHLVALEDFPVLEAQAIQKTMYAIMSQKQRETFEEKLELDFAYSLPGRARFRVNVYRQRDAMGAAFRLIPFDIKQLEDLGVPPAVANFAMLPRGFVLVTGPTGSGKSTTLAAVVDKANRSRADHIMTVEDPIEFLHEHKRCLVNQREVGEDTWSFKNALKHALRQDPDIILVGELRDLETIEIALTAAETGHLVMATLHTQDAAQTIDRVIDVFPPSQQQQVRVMLSGALQGVVCQQLVPTADGKGRVAAVEVMTATPAIRNLIREGKTHQIYSMLQAGAKHGMQTMDSHLADLVKQGRVTYDAALEKCHHVEDFNRLCGRG